MEALPLKQFLLNLVRLAWVGAKTALLLWLLTRSTESPVFLYQNF